MLQSPDSLTTMATVQDYWINPANHETFTDGTTLKAMWQPDLDSLFGTYCTKCDITKVDLCLQPYTNRNWQRIVGSR